MTMKIWSLDGLTPYDKAHELQLQLVELRAADRIPDTVLFLEHEPVITRGRGLQFTGTPRPRHMPAPVSLPEGIAFHEAERGGDLTYHGPGQLVIYPICKLDGKGFGPNHDVAGFLRKLEQLVIDECQSWGFPAEVRENATGVWVGDKKLVSVGIAVRRWVTYHGIAINCVNDLGPFHLISPCGFSPEVMTCLRALMTEKGQLKNLQGWAEHGNYKGWRIALESRLARRLAGGLEVEPEIRRIGIEEALERVWSRVQSHAAASGQPPRVPPGLTATGGMVASAGLPKADSYGAY